MLSLRCISSRLDFLTEAVARYTTLLIRQLSYLSDHRSTETTNRYFLEYLHNMAIIATLNESESAENTVSNEIIDTDDNCQSQVPPVAIVGLGMRLPGAIHTAEQLWKTLVQKRSTRCEIPASRFSVDGFHSPSAKPGSVAMRHGHFLDDSDDLHHLDTSLFSMGITEVKDIDPQQRMLLEVVYECMESSGQVNWQGSNIGCYVGVWGEVSCHFCSALYISTLASLGSNFWMNYRTGSTFMLKTCLTRAHIEYPVVTTLRFPIALAMNTISKAHRTP